MLYWLNNKLLIKHDEDYEWSNSEERVRYSIDPYEDRVPRLFRPNSKYIDKEDD